MRQAIVRREVTASSRTKPEAARTERTGTQSTDVGYRTGHVIDVVAPPRIVAAPLQGRAAEDLVFERSAYPYRVTTGEEKSWPSRHIRCRDRSDRTHACRTRSNSRCPCSDIHPERCEQPQWFNATTACSFEKQGRTLHR